MDDGKRENNKIKRPKSENVKTVLSVYLHKRQFASIKPKLISEHTVLKRKILDTRISRQNSILYNFISDCDPLLTEYSFVFQKFTLWLKDQIHKKHRCHDLEMLIGPLFCHFYFDIRSSGKTHEAVSSSNSFFKTHIDKVDKTKCNDIVKGIIRAVSAATENMILNGSDYPSFDELKDQFRSSKTQAHIKPESLILFKNFVAASSHIESNILILQTLKSWFDFHVISGNSNGLKERREMIIPHVNSKPSLTCGAIRLQNHKDNLHTYLNFDIKLNFVKQAKEDDEKLSLPTNMNSKCKGQNEILLEKVNDIINKSRKLPSSICNIRILNTKNTITCGLIRSCANLVILAESNFLRILPLQVLLDSVCGIEQLDHIRFIHHSKQIYSIALCPRNDIVCTGSADHSICVYSLSKLKFIRRLLGHLGPVYCLAISGNSKYIASGSHDGTLRMWSLKTGKILRLFAGHTDAITCVHFHPNSMYLVSGSADRNVRMWCINSGNPVRLLYASKKEVYAVAFSPNGLYIACASDDKKVRIWDISTSKIVHEFKNRESSVIQLLWNNNSKQLCGSTLSGVVKIWEVRDKDHSKEYKHSDSVIRRGVSGILLSLDYSLGAWTCLSVPRNSPFDNVHININS